MKLLILFIVLSFVLMVAPILVALISARIEKSEPLLIRQSNSKNPRYFALSFCKMFEKAWKNYDGSGSITLSKTENIIETDKITLRANTVCDAIVCAWYKNFTPPAGICFHKEIYAKQNAKLIATPELRAIACRKSLYLGANTHLLRWADALGDITIEENCRLGISVTGKGAIHIGENCSFQRLYGKEIVFNAADANAKNSKSERQMYEMEKSLHQSKAASNEIVRNVRYVDEKNTDEEKQFTASIITKHDLTILSGFSVQGAVHSHKSVRLDRGAVVCGNIFAEGNIFLEKGARVYGDVFSQGSIFLSDAVQIGQYGKSKSVIARENIRVERNCRIYGFVSAEKGGLCCPALPGVAEDAPDSGVQKAPIHIGHQISMDYLKFSDPKEFKMLNPSCFRNQELLAAIFIPEGVEEILSSFFYGCKNLKHVMLPASLRKIDDFAFFGCRSLQEVVFASGSRLEKIGVSAFEGCRQLTKFTISSDVVSLGEAAFRNCEELSAVRFAPENKMTALPSHLFQGCKKLRLLQLPRGGGDVVSVGVSAFYGCAMLTRLSQSAPPAEIGAYAFHDCAYQPPQADAVASAAAAAPVTQTPEQAKDVRKKASDARKKKLLAQMPAAALVLCSALCAVVIYKLPPEFRQNAIVSDAETRRESTLRQTPLSVAPPPAAPHLKLPKKAADTDADTTTQETIAVQPPTQKEEKVLAVTPEYLVLNTRTMARYGGTIEDIESTAAAANAALGSLPAGVHAYYLAAPDALSMETGAYAAYANDYEQAVQEIYAAFSPEIVTVDAFEALRAHKDEELFLKTDIMWTAMGARYAADAFLEKIGIPPQPLTAFKQDCVKTYNGALDPKMLGYDVEQLSDRVDYYVWRENNTELITHTVNGVQEKYEAPAIALSRGGYNIFIGNNFESAVLQGAPRATRTLLMVGGRMSHGLAVWLTPYFKNVIVLNEENFYKGNETMQQYLEQYDVSDVLIVGEAQSIASRTAQRHLVTCFIPDETPPTAPAP
ncbi:MAG: DHHW family protein [Ruthenibacterium sp.]